MYVSILTTLKNKALGRNRHRTSRRAHEPNHEYNPPLIPSRINSQLSPPPRFQTVNLISTNRTWRFYAPDCRFVRFVPSHLISSHLFHSIPFNSTSTSSPLPPHPLPSPPQTSSPNFLPIARFPTQTRSQTPYLGDFFSLGSVRPLVTISGECRCYCSLW